MIEILHVLIGSMNNGGIESSLMNVYRNIDRTEFKFHFLVHDEKENFYEKEILNLGGDLYRIPYISHQFFRHISQFYKFLKLHPEFKLVHIHTTYAITFFDALIARLLKRKVIVHSHNSTNYSFKRKIFHTFFKPLQDACIHQKIACSTLAADWMFHSYEHLYLWKNPIKLSDFQWNPYIRGKIREENNLNETTTIILNVGRLSKQKNQKYLLDIFEEYLKINKNTLLWLIGEGEDEGKLKKICQEKHVEDNVVFFGSKNNVTDYLQAADIFCFPSLYEGLPVCLIEAQCSNLPIVMSSTISDEIIIADNLKRLDIKDSPLLWANVLNKVSGTNSRKSITKLLIESGFSIDVEIKKLENLYKKLI